MLKISYPEKRWAIFPIQHMDLWDLYKRAQHQHWVAEEVDLSSDKFNELSPKEQAYLKNLLAFFTVSDGMVIDNLALNFLREVEIPEAQYFYAFQASIEGVHAEMYSLLTDTYIKDQEEKNAMFNAVSQMPLIKEKTEWAINWIGSTSFAERLVAFACVEGIAFSSTFAGIFWFRSRGKMTGLANANDLIMNDENLHYEFAVHLYNNYLKSEHKLPTDKLRHIILDCYKVEESFVNNILPEGLDGLTKRDMIQYVQYVTDTVLLDFGLQAKFNVPNPLDYMSRIALPRRGNFFESRGNNDYTRVSIPTSTDLFSENF